MGIIRQTFDLGVKCSEDIATAIPGAAILAKLSTVLVQQGSGRPTLANSTPAPRKVTFQWLCAACASSLPQGHSIISAHEAVLPAGLDHG
ncbi:hypothetical protein J0S82_002190 [Galemys pyrenaicus]|uniref:Uncharacterized protein n=1 Tax=Galemys pyrenaicus TaxID=202257 RepID=A0A8J6A6B7_GALPY|nr:hypothetical protein J0S82_002190 [Galemys pyrenaicus]